MNSLLKNDFTGSDYTRLELDCSFLETGRLILRPPHFDDIEDLAGYANNFKVAGNLGRMPYPYFDADAREYIEKTKELSASELAFAITKKENSQFMGMCGLHPADERYELPYIGYWLGEQFWGNGYATEAARAMVSYYFKATSFESMMISAVQNNAASNRVIEKCGGKLWKPGRMYSAAHGKNLQVNHYLVTRETWLETRSEDAV